jgi:Ni2+-binding GTPase involved in maturation of urease and hydrogenase
MDLHVVGGFLGSGKTTAIIGAAKQLMQAGQRVGVITNDQGKYLVDTAFISLQNIPTVEVTGGCFCCNYDDLDKHLDLLKSVAKPDVIFAESVGSCADMVATVMKPLLQLRKTDLTRTSLSVFVDSRLLRRRLLGLPLMFSEDVCYIFDKQLEEAGIVVINKRDLLVEQDAKELELLVQQHFPNKFLRFQNSLDHQNIAGWLKDLEAEPSAFPEKSLEIDYARYGAGEAQLAWLDEEISLSFPPGEGRQVLITVIGAMIGAIRQRQLPVGHVKFLIRGQTFEQKVSFVTLEEPNWQEQIPSTSDDQIHMLINARVETEASTLREIVHCALEESVNQGNFTYVESAISAFHPGSPRPTHRVA